MFYPIPSLNGNFEIDEKGNVRDAVTKKAKQFVKGRKNYCFWIKNKRVWIGTEALLDEVFGKPDIFLPIPSLNNKYEINERGKIRNSQNKKVLKNRKKGKILVVSVYLNGLTTERTIPQLLWEVFGRTPLRTTPNTTSAYLMKDGRNLFFPSIYKASFFLADNLCYAQTTMLKYLCHRCLEIGGWKIIYKEPDKRVIKYIKHF